MFIKDFDHFVDRRSMTFGHEYLDNMMFFMDGEPWKEIRSIISPIFTSGKLKGMYTLINKVGRDFTDHVDKLAKSKEEVNARDLSSRYTMQVIASTGFGIETPAFEDDESGKKFRKMARKITGAESGAYDAFKLVLSMFLPKSIMKALKIEVFDKESVNFFGDIIKQTMKSRKGHLKKRNDMVDLLMSAMQGEETGEEEGKKVPSIPKDKIEVMLISQLIMLFFAALDTSATQLAVLMFFLAKNPEVQEKLEEEISDALAQSDEDELDYDKLQSLPYLDMVVNEALRIFPTGDIMRQCVKEYHIPGTDFTVPKGMTVMLPATGIQSDDKYFPNPEQFRPENFSKENKEKRNPYAFLTFGIGPRNCVGSRLALLQIKSGLVHLVYKYKVLTCTKTPEKLIIAPTSQNQDVEGGIWVTFERRSMTMCEE